MVWGKRTGLIALMLGISASVHAQTFPDPISVIPPSRPLASRDTPLSTGAVPETGLKSATQRPPLDLQNNRAQASNSPQNASPLSEAAIVDRANAYFNNITTLTGDFVQVGSDGRRLNGKLNLQRPGKLRFDYEANPVEVVTDGTSVAIRDRKLATQDLYPIGQTPLKFLVRDKIDLRKDVTVQSTSSDPVGVRLILEDKSTLGGTSKIALYFDRDMEILQQWRITDPQGGQTSIILSNLEKGRRLDPKLFIINYDQQIFDRK
jgi:outer membrane lipoprotein-sorting protein